MACPEWLSGGFVCFYLMRFICSVKEVTVDISHQPLCLVDHSLEENKATKLFQTPPTMKSPPSLHVSPQDTSVLVPGFLLRSHSSVLRRPRTNPPLPCGVRS